MRALMEGLLSAACEQESVEKPIHLLRLILYFDCFSHFVTKSDTREALLTAETATVAQPRFTDACYRHAPAEDHACCHTSPDQALRSFAKWVPLFQHGHK